MQEFNDKVAVITGASSGLGSGLARRCVAEGMKVAIADVEEKGLAALAEELEAAGAEVHARRTDVRDTTAVEELAESTLEAFGAVHLVFNNAGVMLGGVSWERTDDDWRWVLDVNLFGVIHGLRTFMPILLEQGEPAHMVNTASIGGLMVGPFLSPYIVSKHAVVALTESAYHELAARDTPVRISAFCPGAIATGITSSERIRPADRSETRALESAEEREFEEAVRQGIAIGMHPDEAARVAFEGIRAERFWIYTHDDWAEPVRARAQSIIDGSDPREAQQIGQVMPD